LLVLAFSAFWGCDEDEPVEVEAPAASDRSPDFAVVEDTLSSGQSLYTSLVGGGIDASRAVEVLDVLGETVNLRSCKPGDSYTAEISEDGVVVALCYRRGLRELYHVRMD
jgi:hypothetical protein